MYSGILLTHQIVVTLFVLIYLTKAVLMLSGKKDSLAKFTKVTKVPEMIVSLLFLATGVYLATKLESFEMWFVVKLAAVFASIPLAIIGVKKENKALLSLAVILLIYAYGVAETHSPIFVKLIDKSVITDPNQSGYDIMEHGQAVYEGRLGNYKACIRCHGKNGDLGKEESTDLSKSDLSMEKRILIITKGKKKMPAYEDKLSTQDITAVATYLEKLRK